MTPELPETAAATFCATLVDEWEALGLTHAVISPGSRSTPMALALASAPGVQVRVVLDERSAAFVALGIARSTRRPVPVVTTSGSATANLHPAVVEAHQDGVPLILCTADRPPELHGVGAPQTIDQQHLYGGAVRRFVDAGVPDETDPSTWRSLAQLVWAEAQGRPVGQPGDAPGPVQCNLPFRDPLTGRPGALPAPSRRLPDAAGSTGGAPGLVARDGGARVLVVCGPTPDPAADIVREAAARGWPVLLDPRAGPLPADADVAAVAHADPLLRVPAFAESARPDAVLRLGPLPASKVLGQWLDALDAHQVGVDPWGRRFDPGGSLDELVTGSPLDCLRAFAGAPPAPAGWRERWLTADRLVGQVLDDALADPAGGEPAVARLVTEVARRCGAALVVSSSMPIRDVEWYGVRGATVHANRGANGIDGVVSTTVGVAVGSGGPTIGLLGDLAFLHDTNGLLALRDAGADCALVVLDNDGGGIFHFLPQRAALAPPDFERLYGTPHGLDLVAVARAHGVPADRVTDRGALRRALEEGQGPRVVVVPGDRSANEADHRDLQAAITAAVEASLSP